MEDGPAAIDQVWSQRVCCTAHGHSPWSPRSRSRAPGHAPAQPAVSPVAAPVLRVGDSESHPDDEKARSHSGTSHFHSRHLVSFPILLLGYKEAICPRQSFALKMN